MKETEAIKQHNTVDADRRRVVKTGAALSAASMLPLAMTVSTSQASHVNDELSTQIEHTHSKEGRETMSINTVRYKYENDIHWGVVKGDNIIPVPGQYATTGDFINAVSVADLKMIEGSTIALKDVMILSPITQNQRFVCQGANYRRHMIESGMNPEDKNFNMIFTKSSSSMAPHNTDIVRPSVSKLLDYEVELGVVLKAPITGAVTINSSNLHEYVAGVVIVNDITARDVQIPQMQFYKGKSFRTFGPIGPFLCLMDKQDLHYMDKLQLTLKVNGEVRQNDSSGDMVYRPADTLTELSSVHDFDAGDLLATGTPAGCALTVPSPAKQKLAAMIPEAIKWKLFLKMQGESTQYLQPGDSIETTIRSSDGVIDLGKQSNAVVQG